MTRPVEGRQDIRDGFGVAHNFRGGGLNETLVLGKYRACYRREGDELTVTDPTGHGHTIRLRGGGLVELSLGNGSNELTQYGPNGRCLARVTTRRGATKLWARTYRYSPEGDLKATEDSISGTTAFRYDASHRLVAVRRPRDEDEQPIELDVAGNILRMPGLRHVSLRDGNRLSSANGETFEYNPRNHIASRTGPAGTICYHYDSRDQLVKVERPGQSDWTAGYDPLGRRAWKAWGTHRVEFIWDTDRLIAKRDESGRTRVYVYADPFALCR